MSEIVIQPSIPIKKIEEKAILDVRTFLPCHVKEVEEWNWRKAKNEKWLVHLDDKSRRLRKWKLT